MPQAIEAEIDETGTKIAEKAIKNAMDLHGRGDLKDSQVKEQAKKEKPVKMELKDVYKDVGRQGDWFLFYYFTLQVKQTSNMYFSSIQSRSSPNAIFLISLYQTHDLEV